MQQVTPAGASSTSWVPSSRLTNGVSSAKAPPALVKTMRPGGLAALVGIDERRMVWLGSRRRVRARAAPASAGRSRTATRLQPATAVSPSAASGADQVAAHRDGATDMVGVLNRDRRRSTRPSSGPSGADHDGGDGTGPTGARPRQLGEPSTTASSAGGRPQAKPPPGSQSQVTIEPGTERTARTRAGTERSRGGARSTGATGSGVVHEVLLHRVNGSLSTLGSAGRPGHPGRHRIRSPSWHGAQAGPGTPRCARTASTRR